MQICDLVESLELNSEQNISQELDNELPNYLWNGPLEAVMGQYEDWELKSVIHTNLNGTWVLTLQIKSTMHWDG